MKFREHKMIKAIKKQPENKASTFKGIPYKIMVK